MTATLTFLGQLFKLAGIILGEFFSDAARKRKQKTAIEMSEALFRSYTIKALFQFGSEAATDSETAKSIEDEIDLELQKRINQTKK